MKRFTIGLPNESVNNSGSIKNRILERIKDIYPFFKWNVGGDKEFDLQYAGPKDRLIFDFGNDRPRFFAWNRRFWNPFNTMKDVPTSTEHYTANELNKALLKLHKYAKQYNNYFDDNGYDYITANGEPVRIYQTFIQIGDHIFPFKGYNLKSYKKETPYIINVILNIVNNVEITA